MAKTEFKDGPDLAGWAIAAGAAVVALAVCIVVGGFALTPAVAIAAVIFLVVGLILGLPKSQLPGPGEVKITTPDLTGKAAGHAGAANGHAAASSAAASSTPVATSQLAAVSLAQVAQDTHATPVLRAVATLDVAEPAAMVAAAAPASGFVAMVPEASSAGPERLSAPRGGVADDLKEIEGIGPALEKLCNELGFYHFNQIANWTDDDVIWVDDNMPRFKGRIERDKWVAQAKLIVSEGLDAFRIRAQTNNY